jgi:hypothetical protein
VDKSFKNIAEMAWSLPLAVMPKNWAQIALIDPGAIRVELVKND